MPDFTGHILVAEDVKANQLLIKLLLEQMGLEVTMAEDGEEAIAKALMQKFDLILMDIQMPIANGFQGANLTLTASLSSTLSLAAFSMSTSRAG